jgi:hypothetical protein
MQVCFCQLGSYSYNTMQHNSELPGTLVRRSLVVSELVYYYIEVLAYPNIPAMCCHLFTGWFQLALMRRTDGVPSRLFLDFTM